MKTTTKPKPTDNLPRLVRGGGWYVLTEGVRTTARHYRTVSDLGVGNGVGFRTTLAGRSPR